MEANHSQITDSTTKKSPTWDSRLMLVGKMFLIGFLALLLGIPLLFIQFMVSERQDRQVEVSREIAATWGREQTIMGPVLVIPYKKYYRDEDNIDRYSVSLSYFLPENLQMTSNLKSQLRQRSIFEVPVYESLSEVSGSFKKPDFSQWAISEQDVLWDQAYILLGLSEIKNLQNKNYLDWNGKKIEFRPLRDSKGLFDKALRAQINYIDPLQSSFSFKTKLSLTGSLAFSMAPLGEETHLKVRSDWRHPNFSGSILPVSRQIIDEGPESGFTAEWKAMASNRGLPLQWLQRELHESNIRQEAFSVALVNPVNNYRLTTRSNKYSMLFVSLTFLTFFLFEIFNKKVKVHPIQYLFVGFSLCIFYLLLLSLSEVIGFNYAYLNAAAAIVILITFYSVRMLKSIWKALVMGAALSGLYLCLYILLQLEDYALLAGSIGLFAILASIMLVTRKVDWYRLSVEKDEG